MAAALQGKSTSRAYVSKEVPSAARRDVSCRFCPMCVTAAIVSAAPGIAAAVGGLAAGAAAKAVLHNQDKRAPHGHPEDAGSHTHGSRPVVDKQDLPAVTLSYEEF